MHRIIADPAYQHHIPMIDGEFDRFELNDDLGASLREAESASFYHDAFDMAE